MPTWADPKTYPFKNTNYSQDASSVYFIGKVIPNADRTSFAVYGLSDYAKDNARVYYGGTPIVGASPATFEYLGGAADSNLYAKDAGRVYWHGNILSAADPKTFFYLGGGFAKDAEHVFHHKNVFADADPKTFTYLGKQVDSDREFYSKDASHVYFGDRIIPEASPLSFQPAGDLYAKGLNVVYYAGAPIHADYLTLMDLDESPYAKDRSQAYFQGVPFNATDLKTLTVFSALKNVAKDSLRVYSRGKLVQGARPGKCSVLTDLAPGGTLVRCGLDSGWKVDIYGTSDLFY